MAVPPFRVTHIVFDVDGTLVDFETALRAALAAAAEAASLHLGTIVTPAQLRQARELVVVEPAWRGRMFTEVRDESIRRVLASAGGAAPEAVGAVAAAYYAARDANLHAYEDVEPTLHELAERGFTLVAATNGNAVLSQHAFMEHVSHHQQAERIGVAKPNPEFFTRAIGDSGGQPELGLSIGDRVDNDIAPAHRAGLQAIFLDRHDVAPDINVPRVSSLSELLPMVEFAG